MDNTSPDLISGDHISGLSPFKTKEHLNKEYSPSECSNRLSPSFGPDAIIQDYVDAARRGTKEARESLPHDLGVSVSDSSSIDIYWPDEGRDVECAPSSVFVYVHGGNWEALSKDDCGHMATTLCPKKSVVVVVDYTIAPKGTLLNMVHEVTSALVYVARRFSSSRIDLCGFSAGAHLVAQSLSVVDWQKDYGLDPSSFHSAVLLCGLFDLRLIQHSYVNENLKLTVPEARQLSPVHNVGNLKQFFCDRHSIKVILAVGEFDSKEYRQLSSSYKAALQTELGIDVRLEVLQGLDHFLVDLCLADAGSPLYQVLNNL